MGVGAAQRLQNIAGVALSGFGLVDKRELLKLYKKWTAPTVD
jgi:hypothetical protein